MEHARGVQKPPEAAESSQISQSSHTNGVKMDALHSLQEEIGERLCTLPREKFIELGQFLEIHIEANVTRLSLVSLLSSYLLRKDLEELEDGGMAELLNINEKLSEMVLIDVNEQNSEQRHVGEIKHATDSLPSAQTSLPVPQSTRSAPASADGVAVNTSLPPQGQMV